MEPAPAGRFYKSLLTLQAPFVYCHHVLDVTHVNTYGRISLKCWTCFSLF